MKKALISFVGINDSNRETDGAILTVFKDKKSKFVSVHLLWNPSEHTNFFEVAKYNKNEIIKRKHCSDVSLHSFECDDVTDHNEIYPALLEFCKKLDNDNEYTAAIASGTPSMQACWILMAESGDFPLKLIRSNDPKYNKKPVSEVKLGTSLPRIVRLEEENKILKREMLKDVRLNIKRAEILIGDTIIDLAPAEFAYYRYFLQRKLDRKDALRVDIDMMPDEFCTSYLKLHRETFPDADTIRMTVEKRGITTSTFRGNISKLNKKISKIFKDKKTAMYYCVLGKGERYRKLYEIDLPEEKIRID